MIGTIMPDTLSPTQRSERMSWIKNKGTAVQHPFHHVLLFALCVACTRARDHLLVTGVAPASEFLDDFGSGT
jgi:hypothetical protein